MPTPSPRFGPGALVSARGRDWIVLTGSDDTALRLRPVSGSEDEQVLVHLGLESVTDAAFPRPDALRQGSAEAARLLRDALQLSLRRGAGPFRSFGQIAVEPRAYQLVPLLMALKLDTVRLLVADDVGIGKTIEAGLIARELLDRGDVSRTTVLCPPHLVDQWVQELEHRFHIRAVAVTAASAGRLERELPPGERLFTAHPHTVVSLDYIKAEKRRAAFLDACPELVVVDEAHTCASTGAGRHHRHALLRAIADAPSRHLVLLTATPHSGDDEAFHRLLGLLHQDFERLREAEGEERDALRQRLAAHFVQRRRPDIDEWQESRSLFPRRDPPAELTYRLSGKGQRFFDDVLDYCAAVVETAGSDERRRRLNFWGTLALMRCVASSPAAARQALRTRAGHEEETDEALLEARVFDGVDDALTEDDVEPPAGGDDPALASLIDAADRLIASGDDPKLQALVPHLQKLLDDGFSPIVFCRYIATAAYLGEALASRLSNVTVDVVTGEVPSSERAERVAALGEAEGRRLLVATDCLSEGVNLQDHFDAVVHYDLSWNPTRHEQREGRVDRFGQQSPVVRTTMLYGVDNPVDGAVLEVILRKAAKIRSELGVPVPLPDSGEALTAVLMKAMALRSTKKRDQMAFDFASQPETASLHLRWNTERDREKQSRTVFAQRRLKPAEVLPEFHRSLQALGSGDDVRRFTDRALARLGAGLETLPRGFLAALHALPEDVRERLDAEGLPGTLRIDFTHPPAGRSRYVHRSHPVVSVLAETLLERTLAKRTEDENDTDPAILGRVGAWSTAAVTAKTVVALLRLRHQLTHERKGRAPVTLLVEEASGMAFPHAASPLTGPEALALLDAPPVSDVADIARKRHIERALGELDDRLPAITAFAEERAESLLADHRRVRDAADARGTYTVKTLLPVDVVGLYVLLPPR